jgi:YebC/PmpR family DNA-binding regulatory protein
MGRIFETRKSTMMARWDRMAKAFTRVGREIAMAVRAGGTNPDSNPALRRAIQNGRAANMPKDKIEAAIKKASGQGGAAYDEIVYEGYGPHGVAILVETATDNPVRTVANVRMHFSRGGGNMANSGAVSFLFKRMGVFRVNPEGVDAESLELDLIDFGLEELGESTNEKGEPELVVRCAFSDFGTLQKALEDRKIAVNSSALEYVPASGVELSEEQANEVFALVDRLEQDDDVQRVFHNIG